MTADLPAVDLLTADELELLDLLAEVANRFSAVIGDGQSQRRALDVGEVIDKIHQLQHTVMSQAAARAYPERFRLLGDTAEPVELEPIGQEVQRIEFEMFGGESQEVWK